MTRVARYAAVVLCAMLVCNVVLAAEDDADRLKLKLAFEASYTDNRDSVPDEFKDSNLDLLLIPYIGYTLYGESTDFVFYYEPALRYRDDPSTIQNDYEVMHALGLNVKYNATPRMELRAWDTFSYTDDPTVSAGGATVRNNRSFILNRAGVGLIHQITPRSNLDIYGNHLVKRYDKETGVGSESDEDQGALGINVWSKIAETVSLQVMGSFTAYAFDHSYGLDRDFSSVFGGVGLQKAFTEQLDGGVKVGVQSQEYSDDSLDSQVVPFGEIWVKGCTVPTTELHCSLGHGIREAHAYPFASQEYSEARAGVKAELTESGRWIVDLWGVYRLSAYEDQEALATLRLTNPELAALAAALGIDQISGDETTIEVEGGITFRITERCSVKLTQRFEDLDSDVGISFTKNSTALRLSTEF